MSTTITYHEMLDQVSQATDACEGEYDNDAIVRTIIDVHGLTDVEELSHNEFWAIVVDSQPEIMEPSDPFTGIDENTESDARRPAVS